MTTSFTPKNSNDCNQSVSVKNELFSGCDTDSTGYDLPNQQKECLKN